MSCRSARPDDFGRVLLRRVAAVHLAEHFDGSAFAEGSGEGVAELLVVCFQVADAGGGRFEAATITRLLEHFQHLFQGIATDPGQRLTDLPLLSEAEREQVLVYAPEPDGEGG